MRVTDWDQAATAGGPHAARPRASGDDHLTPASALLALQRTAGNARVSALLGDEEDERSPVHDVAGSGRGSPLDAGARSFLEPRLGSDFSDVRIHTGAQADHSARSVNAQAYTVGSDIVFREGAYQPDTDAGRHVLAHELTHVIQQRSGPVDGSPAPGGILLSDPADAFEQAAQRSADQAMVVQREGQDEDELTAGR